jgi:hypothetical protein
VLVVLLWLIYSNLLFLFCLNHRCCFGDLRRVVLWRNWICCRWRVVAPVEELLELPYSTIDEVISGVRVDLVVVVQDQI